ncbi:MAG: hypothetical protein GY866_16940 [Proteobacteria bacterium]|nr:hypothetical protein [Pseudomonadota bacterium]
MEKIYRSLLLLLTLVLIAAIPFGCKQLGFEDEDDDDDSGYSVTASELEGTWEQVFTDSQGTESSPERRVLKAVDGLLVDYSMCGIHSENYPAWTVSGATLSWTIPDGQTITATVSSDKNTITGSFTADDGSTRTFSVIRVSDSTETPGDGTLILQGTFCGQTINLNAPTCSEKNYDSGVWRKVQINTEFDGGWIGLEIQTPHLLASNTTLDITSDHFEIEFQGDVVEDCKGYQDERATSGTVAVETYNGSNLKGTFDIVVDGNDLTGSFDVELPTDP